MKPESKNYTPAKADRELPVPAVCQVNRKKTTATPVACDEALICERCRLCLYHCTCSEVLRLPAHPKRRLRRGETPEGQMQLCEKPQLRVSFQKHGDPA